MSWIYAEWFQKSLKLGRYIKWLSCMMDKKFNTEKREEDTPGNHSSSFWFMDHFTQNMILSLQHVRTAT